jgi:hypothetical protein
MLFADKRKLESGTKVRLNAIREKELDYYVQNCRAMGLASALLSGFAWAGLTQVAIPVDKPYVLKLSYQMVTGTSMCLELIAVMNTTLLSMLGPGLALRGPEGAMHPAVDGMVEEYQLAYFNFVLGLVFFHGSAAIYPWLSEHWAVSIIVSAVVAFSLHLLLRFAARVHARFKLDESEAVVTGRFTGDTSYLGAIVRSDEWFGGSATNDDGQRYASREQMQLASHGDEGHEHWQ